MNKIFFAFVFVSLFFAACDNGSDENIDELKKENQELKDALAANSTITNVEFSGNEMTLTYSNGLKMTTTVPEVLKGEDGETPKIGDNDNWWIGDTDTGVAAQGDSPRIGENGNWWVGDTDTEVPARGADGVDGVGIQSITFDAETGVMTITLTNGKESKFVIDNKDGLAAYIMEDLNGKYLVKRITMGDLPYAEVEYNADNQISKLTSYDANGYETFKSFEVEKEYENGLPTKVITRRYAEKKTTKYTEVYSEDYYQKQVSLDEDKGSYFVEEIDGQYFYYSYSREQDGKYIYYKHFATKNERLSNEWLSNGDGTYTVYKYNGYRKVYNEEVNSDYGPYDYYHYYGVYNDCLIAEEQDDDKKSEKIAENQFKIYIKNEGGFNIDGEDTHKYYYRFWCTRTIEGTYNPGDLLSETYSEITYDSSNQIDKTYESKAENEEAQYYYQNSYDGDLLAKTEKYNKQDGNWVKESRYLTYTYTSEGLLYETTDHDAEGNEKVVGKLEYDSEGNPVEIFKYDDITYRDFYGDDYWKIIDPETGLHYNYDDVYESGLYSYAKIEYNYTMKNFFGNTFAGLFPELYGFNFNNALKAASISNTVVAGAVEYKDFNDGGYPETMQFIGHSAYEFEGYVGQIKVEYQKIEE
nr:hypothetical protein [uncultured Marinifilum sp.]